VVVGDLEQARRFCELITGQSPAEAMRQVFDAQSANSYRVEDFTLLAQVSQTTMLYDETMQVRDMLTEAFRARFGPEGFQGRLMFEPTVCRATQDRQAAAVELCRSGPDVAVVVGGFGSSNTRHLFELAQGYAPAVFIEDAEAIRSQAEVLTIDLAREAPLVARDWLPLRRPLRIGVLAGASSPEVVVGEVLQRLAAFLS
jgi:4-hydroxy-3-methylbut-2-enyl diphosphate reductase